MVSLFKNEKRPFADVLQSKYQEHLFYRTPPVAASKKNFLINMGGFDNDESFPLKPREIQD